MSAFQQAKPLSRVTAHLIAAFQGFSGAVNEEQISRISSVQIDAYGGAELAASTTTFDRKVLSAVCPPYAEAGKSGKRVRRKSMATVSNSSGPQPPGVYCWFRDQSIELIAGYLPITLLESSCGIKTPTPFQDHYIRHKRNILPRSLFFSRRGCSLVGFSSDATQSVHQLFLLRDGSGLIGTVPFSMWA